MQWDRLALVQTKAALSYIQVQACSLPTTYP